MSRFRAQTALKIAPTHGANDEVLNSGMIKALHRSQAVIEFSLDGCILNANENFCRALGYTIEEIRGQHHSMFVDPTYRHSTEYRNFWDKLGRGGFEFRNLLHLEHKLGKLALLLGDDQEAPAAEPPLDADQVLLNGPAMPGEGIDQDEIDAMFAVGAGQQGSADANGVAFDITR